jgi:hypothetical protein
MWLHNGMFPEERIWQRREERRMRANSCCVLPRKIGKLFLSDTADTKGCTGAASKGKRSDGSLHPQGIDRDRSRVVHLCRASSCDERPTATELAGLGSTLTIIP